MTNGTETNRQLGQAGQSAARSMLAAVDGRADDAQVNTQASAFRTLGELMLRLSREVSRCGGEDCFARPINGVRSWVPADKADQQARTVEDLRKEVERLRAALEEIAARPVRSSRFLSGERETTQTLARAALDGSDR